MKIQRAHVKGNVLPPECNVKWEASRQGPRGAEVPLDTVLWIACNHAEGRHAETGQQWVVYLNLETNTVYARSALADPPEDAKEYHRTEEAWT